MCPLTPNIDVILHIRYRVNRSQNISHTWFRKTIARVVVQEELPCRWPEDRWVLVPCHRYRPPPDSAAPPRPCPPTSSQLHPAAAHSQMNTWQIQPRSQLHRSHTHFNTRARTSGSQRGGSKISLLERTAWTTCTSRCVSCLRIHTCFNEMFSNIFESDTLINN